MYRLEVSPRRREPRSVSRAHLLEGDAELVVAVVVPVEVEAVLLARLDEQVGAWRAPLEPLDGHGAALPVKPKT